MAVQTIDTRHLPLIQDGRMAILLSKWYPEFVEPMCTSCSALLTKRGVSHLDIHKVPGTYELPYAARHLVEYTPGLDAVICMSVLLQGETRHFEMILNACGQALVDLSVRHKIPVINGIVPVLTREQAEARCTDIDDNKGIEMAVAALEIVAWSRRVAGD